MPKCVKPLSDDEDSEMREAAKVFGNVNIKYEAVHSDLKLNQCRRASPGLPSIPSKQA